MTQKSYVQLWSALILFLLGYTLNVWLYLQGAKPFFSPALFHEQRAGVAIIALIVIPVAHALSHHVASRHAVQFGNYWTTRLPIVFVDGLFERSRDAKIYQGSIIVLVVLLPFFAMFHISSAVIDMSKPLYCRAVEDGNFEKQDGGIWQLAPDAKFDDDCRIGYDPGSSQKAGDEVKALHGVTFFPVVEPLVIIVLFFIDLALALRLCATVFGVPNALGMGGGS